MSNFYRFHWSPTSKEVSDSGDLFYVQKADSRIDGPWSSVDPEPSYIPRQIRMITELRHWQQEAGWLAGNRLFIQKQRRGY